MANGYTAEKDLRHELQVLFPGDTTYTSLGLFNVPDFEYGSDSARIDDPEDGEDIPIGGKKTGDSTDASRPWKRTRDTPIWRRVFPVRGRLPFRCLLHERDDTGLIVDSNPLVLMTGVVVSITKPAGDAGGSDATQFKVGLDVAA